MSEFRAMFPRGAFARKAKRIVGTLHGDNWLQKLKKQLRTEDEKAGQVKPTGKKSPPMKRKSRKRRKMKTATEQATDTATKLRNSRIKRLLLEAKIGKTGRGKPDVTKALRRELNRRLAAENKVREEQKLRENTQRLVERRKLRLAKLLKEIRRNRRG
jgi:hypothetical protein